MTEFFKVVVPFPIPFCYLWVRRAQGEQVLPSASTPFLPVCVQAAEAPPTVHQVAITVSFRSGHQMVLHQATPDMLRQLVAALS